MVSSRCKTTVKAIIKSAGIQCQQVELGIIEFEGNLNNEKRKDLKLALSKHGFELLDEATSNSLEKTELLINKTIFESDELFRLDNSEYFNEKLECDFNEISVIFSEVNGLTVKQYILGLKIERIKEMILYDGLELSEIAPKLLYKSVHQLSGYFKKVTGLSLTYYKKLRAKREKLRKNITAI